ncbi:Asp-tRNA(Asn)/Glu-tRNA(Gln) amidotransferase subunit GatB [candidate division KSB1 bacterium]
MYFPSIGLEVHVQLKTNTKIFCSCSNSFGNEQNSLVCPVCLGLPGVLPVLNNNVVELAIKTALAFNCTINQSSIFARKNYFYPDLPKGYQISQFEEPLSENGYLNIPENGSFKLIGITRIHLEEDAGKLLHPEGREGENESRIDINRCGVPLVEIVSEPDMTTPKEAFLYLTKLKQTLLYLGVSDCNMEEGSLRCDANVSVRPEGTEVLGVKTELKNLNSFKFVEKALDYEINRQISVLNEGGIIKQQTFGWDDERGSSVLMRTKEGSDDYRYFPEPDLIPLLIDDKWLNIIKSSIPELPYEKKNRFVEQYGLDEQKAELLITTADLADYFESVGKVYKDYNKSCNWIISEVLKVLNDKKISIKQFVVPPEEIGELLKLIKNGSISGKIAKDVFAEMVDKGENPEKIIKEKGLEQISDSNLINDEIDKILDQNKDKVNDYLSGKDKLFGFFVGQVMKATKGKANPGMVNKTLRDKLNNLK